MIYEFPNQPSNEGICKPDVIKSAENEVYGVEGEANGSNIPVNPLLQRPLDLATTFFNFHGNLEKENKIEEIYKDEVAHDESESPFCLQSDKSNETDRPDSGCMSDLHQDFQSLTATDLGITKDLYKENEERNTSMTASVTSTERLPSIQPEFQDEVKDDRSEPFQSSRTQNEPEKSCADNTKMKILHERLLEVSHFVLITCVNVKVC